MANFKVIRERVETITKQGTVMVEAFTAEKASGSLANSTPVPRKRAKGSRVAI